EADDGQTSGARYKAWFDANVAGQYGGVVSGEDCYRFRCALLHQGSSQNPQGQYSRVIFIEPSVALQSGLMAHNNVLNDALNHDVILFWQDLVQAARAWLGRVSDSQAFQRNFDRLMRRYPDGLHPYIVGVPVIT